MADGSPMAKRPRQGEMSFGERFDWCVCAQDGIGVYSLLREPWDGRNAKARDVTARAVVQARVGGETEQGLDALLGALRCWAERYSSEKDQSLWMLPAFVWFCTLPRLLARKLDRATGNDSHRKRVVEALREAFQKLNREKKKREGSLVVCCGLLRAYFDMKQPSMCSFLLAAVSKASGGQPDLTALPKSLAVTLNYCWGKLCVIEGNVVQADEKLSWALDRCPASAVRNRQRILNYLIPVKLRLGRYPSRTLLTESDLQVPSIRGLMTIARAVAQGNIRLFAKQLEAEEARLIQVGTYLVVEKLRLVAYRNLCQRVHSMVADRTENPALKHKQDLAPYEAAFAFQDDFDEVETVCMLANLIYIGAIRGYMSDEHKKIVFSKDMPFPPMDTWCSKA
eukprot:TRINITY_DN15442_c0_g2_i1.p1 TRINITY_DN15442_c0_g2~~TRINITY_DN15442_c0_g2_i1.p1  ORF type:complete len:396 (-),score=58.75 TRINITY_DN15442_c0_g2_i1:63-1250(-)